MSAVNSSIDEEGGLCVAHVLLSLDLGGLERLVVDLVREGRRQGQRVAIVCLERPGTLADEAERAGAKVLCMGKPPGLCPRIVKSLVRVFRELKPDVIHTHQIGALVYAGPAARGACRPVVVHTEHGKHYAARRRTRWLGRLASHYAQRFFCVSRNIAEEVISFRVAPEWKITVAPNGIDIAKFQNAGAGAEARRELGIPPAAPVVGAVGRLNEIKRQDLLIRAFARLKLRYEEAHLLLVGDGPKRAELEQLASELLSVDCIHFIGYQAAPERFLQAMDVMALTSRSEGMPLAVLEAWAARVPVVATRVGGVPELIADEQTGLLVEFGDVPGLASAIERLLNEESLARQVRTAAGTRVTEQFSLEQMAAFYQRHYSELLSAGGQSEVRRLSDEGWQGIFSRSCES